MISEFYVEARRQYEDHYMAEINYEILMQIYRQAISGKSPQPLALVN